MIIPMENNARLNITLRHDSGQYRVYVRQEFVEEKELSNGQKYQAITTHVFANGNFFVRVADGRKSQKWLDEGEKFLENLDKDEFLKHWKIGNYMNNVWTLQGMFIKKFDENHEPVMKSAALKFPNVTYLAA